MEYRFADWRKQEDYPSVDSTPPERWKWEFLRRNAAYQKEFEKFKKAEEEGITDPDYNDRLESFLRLRFRVFSKFVIDPATVPYNLDIFMKELTYDLPYIIGAGGERINREHYYKETHVVLLFDISSSISDQLKSAAPLLKEHRDREKIKAEKSGQSDLFAGRKYSIRPEKFQQYLRLLDAEACGNSTKEMAQVLFQGLGSPAQAVYESLGTAKDIRDKEFLHIC